MKEKYRQIHFPGFKNLQKFALLIALLASNFYALAQTDVYISAPGGDGTGTVHITARDGSCLDFTEANGGGPDNWEVAEGGKSESGNVWLDRTKTSPYKFYQFWLNASDEDAKNYIRIFTLFTKEEIEAIEAEQAKAPHLRTLQKALAKDITTSEH